MTLKFIIYYNAIWCFETIAFCCNDRLSRKSGVLRMFKLIKKFLAAQEGKIDVDNWIVVPIMGIIAVAIINGIRTGVDTTGWDATSIVIAGFLGVVVLVRVIMKVFGSGD